MDYFVVAQRTVYRGLVTYNYSIKLAQSATQTKDFVVFL